MSKTIIKSEFERAAPDCAAKVGQFVAWDRAYETGGIQMPCGFGETAEEAITEGLQFLHDAGLKGDADTLIQSVQLIIADPQ